jgi:hypothetical protein
MRARIKARYVETGRSAEQPAKIAFFARGAQPAAKKALFRKSAAGDFFQLTQRARMLSLSSRADNRCVSMHHR